MTGGRGERAAAELAETREALKAAVALCQRHCRDASAEVAQSLWFGVLAGFIAQLRVLRRGQGALPPEDEAKDGPESAASLTWSPHSARAYALYVHSGIILQPWKTIYSSQINRSGWHFSSSLPRL